jgi:hypothetical protein
MVDHIQRQPILSIDFISDSIHSIERKLSFIVKLHAYQIIQNMPIEEGIPLLRRLGLTQSEIAAVFDSTIDAVSVSLDDAKNEPKAHKGD